MLTRHNNNELQTCDISKLCDIPQMTAWQLQMLVWELENHGAGGAFAVCGPPVYLVENLKRYADE